MREREKEREREILVLFSPLKIWDMRIPVLFQESFSHSSQERTRWRGSVSLEEPAPQVGPVRHPQEGREEGLVSGGEELRPEELEALVQGSRDGQQRFPTGHLQRGIHSWNCAALRGQVIHTYTNLEKNCCVPLATVHTPSTIMRIKKPNLGNLSNWKYKKFAENTRHTQA